jgi:hypothetical protein
MTRGEAVRAFTLWNAYAAHQESGLGSLEPGKWADLVVCSADVFTCGDSELPAIEPVLTLVGGEVVLDRRPPGWPPDLSRRIVSWVVPGKEQSRMRKRPSQTSSGLPDPSALLI